LDDADSLSWINALNSDSNIIRSYEQPFSHEGGLRLLTGNLGRSVTKISAIAPENRYVKAPAQVFVSQEQVLEAYKQGNLNCDVVVVLKYQGPKANGMPELHALTPALTSLQDQGYKVALVTDGRMSGASGKVPNAIHLTPEAVDGGIVALVENGDIIELDLEQGILQLHIAPADLAKRQVNAPDLSDNYCGFGRELFNNLRKNATNSETGATVF
jgi:phosphogluconate dehydratase